MAKQKMNTDTLVKKLKAVSNTQDSIPMFSLWIIHHKAHSKLITEQWLQVLKHSKSPHRLTLLYLCNDVVQNCHRKNADVYKEAFCDVLPEAITLLRDGQIRPSVERVINIWIKRKILEKEVTNQLLGALKTTKPPQKLRNKLLVEYKTSGLINEINKFKESEDEIDADQQRLRSLRVDVSSCDAIRQLKDKLGGEKFSKDFEESASQVELFLVRYEKFVEHRKKLLELLEQGSVYYHAQYHEAKIVVNAYKNFEGRVSKMKKGLDRVKERFPNPDGSFHPPASDSFDNQEDMEMSDDDIELGNKPSKIVAVDTSLMKSNQKSETKHSDKVLKFLSSGLSEQESLKKVMSGLISRPGMRGASTGKDSSNVLGSAGNAGSLKITRSIQNTENLSFSVPNEPHPVTPLGSESPPSPTGSPELNISSPPRHQSLDSRLADLFNNATSGDTDKTQSDSESDAADVEVKKPEDEVPHPSIDERLEENPLPGLGDYKNEIPGLSDIFKTASSQDKISSSSQDLPLLASTTQAIPVIGSFFRSTSQADGSNTPTLDEAPYPSSVAMEIPFPPPPSFLTAAQFGGDALGFLSKFVGKSMNPDATNATACDDKPDNNPEQDTASDNAWSLSENKANDNVATTTTMWSSCQQDLASPTNTTSETSQTLWKNSFTTLDNNKTSDLKSNLEPEAKKPRWSVGEVPSMSSKADSEFNAQPIGNRRSSNLITLSGLPSPQVEDPPEIMNQFKQASRRKSNDLQPSALIRSDLGFVNSSSFEKDHLQKSQLDKISPSNMVARDPMATPSRATKNEEVYKNPNHIPLGPRMHKNYHPPPVQDAMNPPPMKMDSFPLPPPDWHQNGFNNNSHHMGIPPIQYPPPPIPEPERFIENPGGSHHNLPSRQHHHPPARRFSFPNDDAQMGYHGNDRREESNHMMHRPPRSWTPRGSRHRPRHPRGAGFMRAPRPQQRMRYY